MLEAVLTQKNIKSGVKITIKSVVSVVLIALACGLPQIVHAVAGVQGGTMWLPMYLPVLLAGLILGVWWGMGVAIISPIVSFIFTSMWGNPMPIIDRLPFMVVELCVFAIICGLFSKHIAKNVWLAFPAVLLAQIGGRTIFVLSVAIFNNFTSLKLSVVWTQIQSGMIGLYVQALLVPMIVITLTKMINKEN